VGKGDVLPQLKEKAQRDFLQDRIHFIPSQPYLNMLQYTLNADLGISLDKDTNINYRFSLPNKIFDYMKCGIPLLVSNLKEPSALVSQYNIGLVTSVDPQDIAAAVLKLSEEGKEPYQTNLKVAATENNWEKESQVLREILVQV
jgi:glycosyltransferase involved in cell wall biosynthesis